MNQDYREEAKEEEDGEEDEEEEEEMEDVKVFGVLDNNEVRFVCPTRTLFFTPLIYDFSRTNQA